MVQLIPKLIQKRDPPLSILGDALKRLGYVYSATQSQKAVTAHFSSKQLLPFVWHGSIKDAIHAPPKLDI